MRYVTWPKAQCEAQIQQMFVGIKNCMARSIFFRVSEICLRPFGSAFI